MPYLCIVSDTHRNHREVTIPDCDILVHCGDFGSFQDAEIRTLDDADNWFMKSRAKHVLCIGGNHDFALQHREFQFSHARCLEDELVEIDGLTMYGTPWCPHLSGFAYYAGAEELLDRWKQIPSGIDILITHTPPFGLLDRPTSGSTNLGCPHLREELKRIRPRLHVFGHVHASHGMLESGGTRYINAAVVGGPDFEVRHRPTTLKLDWR